MTTREKALEAAVDFAREVFAAFADPEHCLHNLTPTPAGWADMRDRMKAALALPPDNADIPMAGPIVRLPSVNADMLAALRALVEDGECYCTDPAERVGRGFCGHCMAKDAIAKAEGKEG